MPNVKDLIKKIESGDISYEEKLAALSQVETTLKDLKEKKDEKVRFNVQLIIDEIKNIKSEVLRQLDYAKSIVPERGPKGDAGERGKDGLPGRDGQNGRDGKDGKDGKDGQDGVSVTDAKIDFDGSLVITLSTGREINVGEVVSSELAEKIKVTMSTNASISIQDEGTTLTSGVRNINFVGATVTTSNSGDEVTVNVSAGTGSVTSVDVSGGTTGLTTSGGPVQTSGVITLGGTLAVANGGTGATTDSGARTNLGLGTAATMTGPSGTIVGTTDTQTLTNKRINPRVTTPGATSGSFTPNGDTSDVFDCFGLTGAITFNAPSGTPVNGQRLIIRIEDNGSSRGITWTTTSGAYRAVGVTLPTTTTASKITYVGCIYNSSDIFWDAIAVVTQA
jgi:hypothetical protein